MMHRKTVRLAALLMALCLSLSLLTACSNQEDPAPSDVEIKDPEPTPAPTPDPEPAPAPQPEPAPEPAPTPDPEPAPVEDPFVAEGNVNPLTGLCDGISDQALTQRPIAVMVNNMKAALPQWGIGQADIIYEMLAEGRITRFLAIYQDYSKINKLASIRSARPYFIDIAQSYGAVFIHFGGSVPAYEAIDSRSDLVHIDGIKSNWEGTVFFRDQWRRETMGLEHSVFTTGEYLRKGMDRLTNSGENLQQTEHPSAFTFGEGWSQNSAVEGESASKVTVTFSSSHKPYFQYDEASQKYLRFQYGKPQMDGITDEQLAVDNVLVIRMVTKDLPSELHLIDIDTTNQGEGFFFTKGKYVPITWQKDSYNGEIVYRTLDGEELVASRGTTFVSVVTTTADSIIE